MRRGRNPESEAFVLAEELDLQHGHCQGHELNQGNRAGVWGRFRVAVVVLEVWI
jgi:hypothetical protein